MKRHPSLGIIDNSKLILIVIIVIVGIRRNTGTILYVRIVIFGITIVGIHRNNYTLKYSSINFRTVIICFIYFLYLY